VTPIKTACGLGKLGACIAATLAGRGFEVVGLDIDPEKVKRFNEGLAPEDEPLLAETIRAGHSLLRATLDPREAVATDVTFSIRPFPSQPSGSFSNDFLAKAMQPVAGAARDTGTRKQHKRRGCRVLVHNFGATPANAPSFHEFRQISNVEEFETKPGVKLAVICCPWPQYRDLVPTAGTSVLTRWQL